MSAFIYIYNMKALKKLYVAIKDNEVVAFGTNLQDFVKVLNDMNISNRNYQFFYREFNKSRFTMTDDDGSIYYLQKVK